MPLYGVHIYRVMKLRFDGIEASTPEGAANIARDGHTEDADDIEDCNGETLSAVVDLVGDADYKHAKLIEYDLKIGSDGS